MPTIEHLGQNGKARPPPPAGTGAAGGPAWKTTLDPYWGMRSQLEAEQVMTRQGLMLQ